MKRSFELFPGSPAVPHNVHTVSGKLTHSHSVLRESFSVKCPPAEKGSDSNGKGEAKERMHFGGSDKFKALSKPCLLVSQIDFCIRCEQFLLSVIQPRQHHPRRPAPGSYAQFVEPGNTRIYCPLKFKSKCTSLCHQPTTPAPREFARKVDPNWPNGNETLQICGHSMAIERTYCDSNECKLNKFHG